METASQFWVLESGIRLLVGLVAPSAVTEPIPASSVAPGGCWQPLACGGTSLCLHLHMAPPLMSVSKPRLCTGARHSNRTSS